MAIEPNYNSHFEKNKTEPLAYICYNPKRSETSSGYLTNCAPQSTVLLPLIFVHITGNPEVKMGGHNVVD